MVDISKRKVLVFDLEVVALDYETSYDEETKKYLIKYALGDPAKEKEAIEQLVFTPYTSRIVAIGMLDYHKDVGAVLVNTENLEYQFEADDSRVKGYIEKGYIKTTYLLHLTAGNSIVRLLCFVRFYWE